MVRGPGSSIRLSDLVARRVSVTASAIKAGTAKAGSSAVAVRSLNQGGASVALSVRRPASGPIPLDLVQSASPFDC